jgi:hypothetical protein
MNQGRVFSVFDKTGWAVALGGFILPQVSGQTMGFREYFA